MATEDAPVESDSESDNIVTVLRPVERSSGPVSYFAEDIIVDNVGNPKSMTKLKLETPGKVIGLFFTAYWCAPGRPFMRKLLAWWNNVKESHKENIAILMLFSDEEEEWYGRFANRCPPGFYYPPWKRGHGLNVTRRLVEKYNVQLIPSLIFIDGMNGDILHSNGRQLVETDPGAKLMSWVPVNMSKYILKGEFIAASRNPPHDPYLVQYHRVKGEAILVDKIDAILLYFSSYKSPICVETDSVLKHLHKSLIEKKMLCQIVYVSADRDETVFQNDFFDCPWVAIPHSDERRGILANYFHVTHIPRIIVLESDMRVITKEGVSCLGIDPEGKDFPWRERPLMELTERFEDAINHKQCVICFTDGSGGQMHSANLLLNDTATAYFDGQIDLTKFGIGWNFQFFYTGRNKQLREKLKMVAGIGDDKQYPYVVVLDVQQHRLWEYNGVLETKPVNDFLQAILSAKEPSIQLKPCTTVGEFAKMM